MFLFEVVSFCLCFGFVWWLGGYLTRKERARPARPEGSAPVIPLETLRERRGARERRRS